MYGKQSIYCEWELLTEEIKVKAFSVRKTREYRKKINDWFKDFKPDFTTKEALYKHFIQSGMDELSIKGERIYRTKTRIKYLNSARTCYNCTNSTDDGSTCLKFAISTHKDASCNYYFLKQPKASQCGMLFLFVYLPKHQCGGYKNRC